MNTNTNTNIDTDDVVMLFDRLACLMMEKGYSIDFEYHTDCSYENWIELRGEPNHKEDAKNE